jgi:myosin-5
MLQLDKNQALVISGESGAGKTENTKFAMKLLTCLSKDEKPRNIII